MVGELRAEASVTHASRAVLRRSKLRGIACSFAVVFGCSSGDHSDSVTLRGWYESTVVSNGVESIGFSDATHYIMWKTCDTSVETCVSTGTYSLLRGDSVLSLTDDQSRATTELPFSVLSTSTPSTQHVQLEDDPTDPTAGPSLTSVPWGPENVTIGGIPMSNTGTPTRNTTPIDESATPSAGNPSSSGLVTGDPTSLVTDDHEASAGNDERAGPFLSLHPFSCPAGTAPTTATLKGIDISHFQSCPNSNPNCHGGNVNFENVAKNAAFVILKATEGNAQSDPAFAVDWQNAKGKVARGAYHFLRGKDLAGQPLTGAVQAQWFFSQIQAAGGLDDGDLPPVMDAEALGTQGLDPADYTKVVADFVTTAEGLFHRRIMLYTGPFFWGGTTTLNPPQLGNPVVPGLNSPPPLPLQSGSPTTAVSPARAFRA